MPQDQEQDNQQQQPQDRDRGQTAFEPTGGMMKDLLDSKMKPNSWYHALNATINLPDGGIGGFHTEPGNYKVLDNPMYHIGTIPLVESQWVLFFTSNNISGVYTGPSEIGIYNELDNSYNVLINDAAAIGAGYAAIGFNTSNLITGVARRGYDCGFDVYWSDGKLNPDRMINTAACPWTNPDVQIAPNPWIQDCTYSTCITCVNTPYVDIQKLLLIPTYKIPCLKLSKAQGSGILINGSYQVSIRYCINGYPCTDFIATSNQQSIWSHVGEGGGLTLEVSGAEQGTTHPLHTAVFTEMEVVIISVVNQQTQAKSLGIYDTAGNPKTIYIDSINPSLKTIPLELLPLSTPAILNSNQVTSIANYLLRLGPSERPDFNYQPLANQIQTIGTLTRYPEAYYHLAGNNVGYMGGEKYAYYIRWRYTTGDASASYHIPAFDRGIFNVIDFWGISPGTTVCEYSLHTFLSSEIYPDNLPQIWNSNVLGHPEYNLCGTNIRHHTFPDVNEEGGIMAHYININGVCYIQVRGVRFLNIHPPVDNQGKLIPDIQGYEILRATRDGNETVLAKGMVNNMIPYSDNGGDIGVFSNFPYNDLRPNNYLTWDFNKVHTGDAGPGLTDPLDTAHNRLDLLSFHSPETVFQQPFLGLGSIQFLLEMHGHSVGKFEIPYKHPMFKVVTDFDSAITTFIALIVLYQDTLNFITHRGLDYNFAATEDLPMAIPLHIELPPEGTGGFLAQGIYYLTVFTEAILYSLMEVLRISILQQQLLNVIKGLIPARQYALQYNSEGFYNDNVAIPTTPYNVTDYGYILGQMQFFKGMTVNNLYRNNYVILQLDSSSIVPFIKQDTSRYLLSEVDGLDNCDKHIYEWIDVGNFPQIGQLSSFYASYVVPRPAQYGQIDAPKQVPIGCMQVVSPSNVNEVYSSTGFWGGDTYVCRYTEKNPFLFFNDWLVDVAEDFIYDYRNYINVPYPMFWINNDHIYFTLLAWASNNRRLDGPINLFTGDFMYAVTTMFYVGTGYFYLFCNGVRDFFVETTLNMGYRDYGESPQAQFYNPYGFTDIGQMFRSDIMKYPEFYKYDFSLSANRFFNQWLTWSSCLRRDYDPLLAYTCFNYYPRRVNYSLPQDEESGKDNWRLFLPNNYHDFPSEVHAVKGVNNNGAMFIMDDCSPMILPGTQSIPSTNGTEYTVGTGSLFDQSLQSVANVERSLQYGSCQGKFCTVNTPFGTFWVSQRAGKIWQDAPGKAYYNQGERMLDITTKGLKYWMSLYLPSQLSTYYPSYQNTDNMVSGVGVQIAYDNINEIIYISKRDFRPQPYLHIIEASGVFYNLTATPSGFIKTPITLGDPVYFVDCSWTVSYSPERKQFISFHSWTPTMTMSGEKHIITSKNGTIWKHNELTDLFCNYYNIQYGWEIEAPLNTGDQVTTIENIEYQLDSYNYKANQTDKFNMYTNTFNYGQLYNKEQATLPLLLNERVWNDPFGALNYPNVTATGLNILYTKVENKYRLSTIRDFTNDRGQFDLSEINMKITNPSGVGYTTNPLYFNIYKNPMELKKLRHRYQTIFLRMSNPGYYSATLYNIKMNIIKSPR